jgi:uncharacterized protein YbjT (DUF2867 family)
MNSDSLARIFVTGGTGYIGRPLITELIARGHRVAGLVRPGSEGRLPAGCEVVPGDALNAASFDAALRAGDSVVHLVGTPHPNPRKAAEFQRVDLGSLREAVTAATAAGVRHFVYLSVAQPAPAMRAYVAARAQGESLLRASGLPATILRPWYVLGPGHRWPWLLKPAYALLERIPSQREMALRLGLVTLDDMVAALVLAVEDGPRGERVLEVPAIRGARRALAGSLAA